MLEAEVHQVLQDVIDFRLKKKEDLQAVEYLVTRWGVSMKFRFPQ